MPATCLRDDERDGAGGRWRRCARLRSCGHGRGPWRAACRAARAHGPSPSSSSRFGLGQADVARAISAQARARWRSSACPATWKQESEARVGLRRAQKPIAASMRSVNCPGIAADRLAAVGVLEPGASLSSMTSACFGAVGKDARAAPPASGRSALLAEPGLERVERLGLGSATFGAGAAAAWRIGAWRGLEPVARLFLDGDVDARLEPPAKRAARLGRADRRPVPHPSAHLSPPLTARSRNWQGGCGPRCASAARREER